MKKIALVSTLALALAPAVSHAGGKIVVAPEVPTEAAAPAAVVPGGVGGAPVAAADP